jgi:glycosyltransferase involved in cell wall biosynthesis
MARIHIAFITADDPRDKRSWSGTNHFLYKAMEKHIGEVDLLGPYMPQPLQFVCSVFNFLTLRLLGKRFDYRHSFLMRNAYGKHFITLLRKKKYDCVVVSASIASAAGIKTNLPVFYINDRVIPGAMNYHKIFTQLFAFSKRQSVATDKQAITNSRVSIFSSHWAANAAINLHHIDPSKVKVIPFGANIEERPLFRDTVTFPESPVRLLFVGVNWHDKGGPIALQCLEALLQQNIDAQLTIVGCHPPEGVHHEKMNVIGFLNKNNPDEFRKLNELFSVSHFFILPTRFEAYGLVFCESAAFGVPALAPATGGIPTIIQDGVTGFLLPEKASGKDYAEKIASLVRNPEKWHTMRKAAHERFENQLNWDAWAAQFRKCLEEQRVI